MAWRRASPTPMRSQSSAKAPRALSRSPTLRWPPPSAPTGPTPIISPRVPALPRSQRALQEKQKIRGKRVGAHPQRRQYRPRSFQAMDFAGSRGVGRRQGAGVSATLRTKNMNQPASAYFMEERHDPNESHTLSVLVQNEPGVLARVIGLFSGRGYNIESLTVSETENQKHVSRITIVTTGTPMVIEQIKHQLDRMVPVYRVVDMTLDRPLDRARARDGQTARHRRSSRRGAAAGGSISRPRDRRHHRKLRIRDHRQLRQDQPVHRPDATARPDRGFAHRRRRDRARAEGM